MSTIPIAARHNNNSENALENGTMSSNSSTPAGNIEASETSWVSSFVKLDRLLSGSSLNLCYRIIDIIILAIGLTSGCSFSNHFAETAISLLAFYFIDISIIVFYFFRNMSVQYQLLTAAEKLDRLRSATAVRGFFMFFKLIPVYVGLRYTLSPVYSSPPECELLRFCLGIVCVSTLLMMVIPPSKPEIPVRRSFLMECFVLLFVLIINVTYLATVGSSISNVEHSSCTYHTPEDLYLRAPLKSYAHVGLLIFSCTIVIHIINLLVSQICHRLANGRRLYINYYALQYALTYIGAVIVVYYFSIGALLLFQPRSGQPCRTDAPGLYKTLLIWQWIRVLTPLFALPLLLLLCCLGVFFGIALSYCLPASITVPLLALIQGWLPAASVPMHPNPPATQENINAIPVVLFGKEDDPFNQSECAICRVDFEANEPLKKLNCGHLFHSACVADWLLITRICPVCRRRMSTSNP